VHHREALALGLQTRDRKLLDVLSTLLAAAAAFGDTGMQMFTPQQRDEMQSTLTRLSKLHLRWYEAALVYGPRYALRAARQRRLVAQAEEPDTRTRGD
jgi:hypothetical protein